MGAAAHSIILNASSCFGRHLNLFENDCSFVSGKIEVMDEL
jgi:hypothetical protein